MHFTVSGFLVNILERKINPAIVTVADGKILSIKHMPSQKEMDGPYIIPGFIDAHVHIESSMLIPSEFARLAVVHGTVATVSDPHEIANVCGLAGVEYMIQNGKKVPFHFYFGAPSCVPATTFETAGATLSVADVTQLLEREEVLYLTEMMNFPGVLNGDEEVLQKIEAAKRLGKPVDGHAPGLRARDAKKYIDAGISTDHECFTKEEAADKLAHGMKIIIREGSAAKNFEALIDLLHHHPNQIMFCSDDKHPDSLVEGHINDLCARAVAKGIDVYHVLQAACINPVTHYGLKTGLLKEGDAADFLLVKDLKGFEVLQTYVGGVLVADRGKSLINREKSSNEIPINNFECTIKKASDFEIKSEHYLIEAGSGIPVIEALDGQLITNKIYATPLIDKGKIVPHLAQDILKIAVVNRYKEAPVAVAFIKNFGLKRGAIASSVAHDSHNIVVVGVDDESICKAVNKIIEHRGGVCCINDEEEMILPLPVGGLMSPEDGYVVAEKYAAIDAAAKAMGSTLSAPFMTLSFMALLVIPHLKLSDKGLFDGDAFTFV